MTSMDEHKTCARRNNHVSLLLLGLACWCRIHKNKIVLRGKRFCQIIAAAYFDRTRTRFGNDPLRFHSNNIVIIRNENAGDKPVQRYVSSSVNRACDQWPYVD